MSVTFLHKRAENLRAMAANMLEMAHDLDSIATAFSRAEPPNSGVSQDEKGAAIFNFRTDRLAEALYKDRRKRSSFFDDDLFAEPAWDILLDLYVNELRGKTVSVTSSCIAAAVPATTGLRWLTMLEQRGLLVRTASIEDARRTWVQLTDMAREKMTKYISETIATHL